MPFMVGGHHSLRLRNRSLFMILGWLEILLSRVRICSVSGSPPAGVSPLPCGGLVIAFVQNWPRSNPG